jgi:hypothetical protein
MNKRCVQYPHKLPTSLRNDGPRMNLRFGSDEMIGSMIFNLYVIGSEKRARKFRSLSLKFFRWNEPRLNRTTRVSMCLYGSKLSKRTEIVPLHLA